MVKVSVYCTVYNHADYLRDALEGFVSQITDFEYEVFVHDDASTDNSAEIIREYESKYPHIIHGIYQKENQYSQGVSIFYKYLLPRFNGEYVAVCEGDDYWCDKEKLMRQVNFLDEHKEYVACVHNTRKQDLFSKTETEMYSNDAERDICFEEVVQGGSVAYQTSSLMFRRSAYQNKMPAYMKSQWDYPVSIYLTTLGKVRYLNRTMSVYRYGTPQSYTIRTMASKSRLIKNAQQIIEMLKLVDEETNQLYSDLIRPVVLKFEYNMALVQGRYAELTRMPLKEIYKEQPWSHKVRVFVGRYCGNWIEQIIKWIRGIVVQVGRGVKH